MTVSVAWTNVDPGSIGGPVAGSAVFASTGTGVGPPLSTTFVIRRMLRPDAFAIARALPFAFAIATRIACL